MQFIDHTGHIFSMPSYPSKPIGYEYEETDYVFWIDSEYSGKLSVDTYYMKPIRVLVPSLSENGNLSISVDSKKFGLIGSRLIHEKVENEGYSISILESEIKQSLSYDDIEIINGITIDEYEDEWSLLTFYAVCNSNEPGTWETNILINVDDDWCPITVGGEVVDECEELLINGQNVGISMPKDILKAIYQGNVFNEVPDERLYAQKMKELLMNYMMIVGEEGNYKSALAALNWFGWGDKIKVYKLLHTDNNLIDQYLRDDFVITNDVITSFRSFRNDALLAFSLPITYEGEENMIDFSANYFMGEGKPQILDMFEKTLEKRYDEKDIAFIKSYFDFTLSEMMMKLVFLKYYYEKFFLPVHMHLNSVAVSTQVWMNDIKMIENAFPKITASPVFISDNSIGVDFPATNVIFLKTYKEIMDENFNVFSNTEEISSSSNEQFYYVYDTLAEIPIKFWSKNTALQLYDVILNLYKDDKCVFTSSFMFTQSYIADNNGNLESTSEEYSKFILHPKTLNTYVNKQMNDKQFDINYWLSSHYKLTLYVNGNNYEYDFELRLPEMNLCMGTLEYKYDDRFRQFGNKILSSFKVSGKANDITYTTSSLHGLHENDCIEYKGNVYKIVNTENQTQFTLDRTISSTLPVFNEQVYIIEKNTQWKLQAFMHMPGLVNINNIDIIEDLYYFQDALGDYVKKYYSTKLNLVNKQYLNRCHIYKLYKKNTSNNNFEEIEAKTTSDENFIELFKTREYETEYISINYDNELYQDFFALDNTNNKIKEIESLYDIINPSQEHCMKYDAFFMIEGENIFNNNKITKKINLYNWYMILISKETIDMDSNIDPPFIENEFEIGGNTYKLVYERSDSKFLINRFVLNSRDEEYIEDINGDYVKLPSGSYKKANKLLVSKYGKTYSKNPLYGKYQFSTNDIIAFYLKSSGKLPYKVGISTKWDIKPMSIGMSNSSNVTSPNEIAIVNVGDGNFRYERGYYNIVCKYSLDDYIQHSMTKIAKFRID